MNNAGMTIAGMLGQSGTLTIFGMAVVFSFLVIMVVVIDIAGRLIGLLNKNDKSSSNAKSGNTHNDTVNNQQITAAITAAVNEYRKTSN